MAGKSDEAELVASAAAGRPLAEIAATAGVSVSTVQRRLRDPAIARAVQEARAETRRGALARVLELRDSALGRVGELLLSDDPTVALRAAALILSSSFKVETAYDFHDRLAALEATQDEGDRPGADDEANGDGGDGDPDGPGLGVTPGLGDNCGTS